MRYRLSYEGWVKLDGSLRAAVQLATQQCLGATEEEGGFIVHRDGEYQFHHITNQHTGQPIAVAFYEPSREEYGEKVIGAYAQGFRNFGSFHTHPTGNRALPSLVDLTRLFNGQPNNLIWSPSLALLNWYKFDHANKAETTWKMTQVETGGLLL